MCRGGGPPPTHKKVIVTIWNQFTISNDSTTYTGIWICIRIVLIIYILRLHKILLHFVLFIFCNKTLESGLKVILKLMELFVTGNSLHEKKEKTKKIFSLCKISLNLESLMEVILFAFFHHYFDPNGWMLRKVVQLTRKWMGCILFILRLIIR